ncbi:hypothetical protein KIW84_012785 [Lathyrus oleraceus]|uniref:Uncharacterized protein n=1 Tax=Pisum sativum TaxID=3888 RepID=A0A9D5GWU6_PEA|nr:hypothetical protein KIW84_012785 [Pisum sativum]
MWVVFKNDAQRRNFELLAKRTISPTRYPDFPTLVALVLTDSHGPHVYSEVPTDDDMQFDLDYLWGGIIEYYPPDYIRMNQDLIYNPTIRYFKMLRPKLFFGKARNIGLVSREDLFFIFSIFQSRPSNSTAFLLVGLDRVANQEIENIYMGGTLTYIAIALGLPSQIALLSPWCRHDLIDIDHYFNSILVKLDGLNEYKIVILSDVVHQFTLPNLEKTSVHNRDN